MGKQGFVIDGPPKVFHLARACNAASIGEVGSPVENQNDVATVGTGHTAGTHKRKVTDSVVTDAG